MANLRRYSAPLAFGVILGLFGVPLQFAPMFMDAGMARSRFHSFGCNEFEVAYQYEESLVRLKDVLDDVLDSTSPGDDTLLAQMAALRAKNEFSSQEIFQILRTFFTAAHENLVSGIPITMMFLMHDDEQRDLVIADPANAGAAYEEGARMEPHTQP